VAGATGVGWRNPLDVAHENRLQVVGVSRQADRASRVEHVNVSHRDARRCLFAFADQCRVFNCIRVRESTKIRGWLLAGSATALVELGVLTDAFLQCTDLLVHVGVGASYGVRSGRRQ